MAGTPDRAGGNGAEERPLRTEVVGGGIGVVFPIDRPAILDVVNKDKARKPKSAPVLKAEFALALGKKANGPDSPGGIRLYDSLFTLSTLTSLRFGDVRYVKDVWLTNTALCGISTNSKDRAGDELGYAVDRVDNPNLRLV